MGAVAKREKEWEGEGKGERTEAPRTVPRMPLAREEAQGERGQATVVCG